MLRMQCSAVRAHTRARVCDAAAGSCRSLDDEAASWRLLPQLVHSGELPVGWRRQCCRRRRGVRKRCKLAVGRITDCVAAVRRNQR